jgi:hypothetical protein
MNEPNILVALVYLGVVAGALLLPAPLLALAALRGERTLRGVAAAVIIVLSLPFAVMLSSGRDLNSGDQALFRNLIILAIAATAGAAWAVTRKRRRNPDASFGSLLATAAAAH